ncbi:hypothetical protein PISMIDRAFT_675495 [Pisolithus microcarpus 441]|uniref:Uncharacterized protein n=1 Tax=Pisolithus microcarpus 441 TaxID=765257 RepID=A0A0C9ZLV5_9AGAM|nr:hypothetical protein BKA83DRAFT_675495 [Pisolithus microcarpus]KIK26879.1 hypothetical protein PISMIDRAFT_675495 [Pisolithus microcarpus 441]
MAMDFKFPPSLTSKATSVEQLHPWQNSATTRDPNYNAINGANTPLDTIPLRKSDPSSLQLDILLHL